MVLLDNYGRLFRKISIIDLLAIILLLGAVYIGLSFFLKSAEWVPVELQICDEKPNSWTLPVCGDSQNFILDTINAGDVIVNYNNKTIGKITKITAYDNSKGNKNIYVQAELLVKKGRNQVEYDNNLLKINSFIKLNFPFITLNAKVIKMFDLNVPTADKIVTVKIREVFPWIDDSLVIGSTETNLNNEAIAKVLDKQTEIAKKSTVSDEGKIAVHEDPSKMDITLKVLVVAEAGKDELRFKGERLGVGEKIVLKFNGNTFVGGIASIE